jgi:hypothetical protein
VIAPEDHFCDVGDLSYDLIDQGVVVCEVCGRVWQRKWHPLSGGVWRLEPSEYGLWHTHSGGRFVNVRTGQVVEGPPPAGFPAQRSVQEKANRPELAAPTGSEVL